MERVGTLINKLKEQFEQQADASSLAMTAQLLLSELQHGATPARRVSGKVSVMMPQVAQASPEPGVWKEEPSAVQHTVEEAPAEVLEAESADMPGPGGTQWLFETQPAEVPTLVHQAVTVETELVKETVVKETYVLREVNHALAVEAASLNERLREEKTEVMSALQDAPVRDLKKAIGINDRYLFVNDLFRGDESMYERSIKTINAFNIYPEAQYWIQRELKVKLSWPDTSDTVRLFDQLIRRRFA